MDADHNIRWRAFIRSQSEAKAIDIVEDQRAFMFRHGWKNPDRNHEEVNAAVRQWREMRMADPKPDKTSFSDFLLSLPYRKALEEAEQLHYSVSADWVDWIYENHPEALS